MDEQNNPVPEPVVSQPAGEANSPVITEPIIAPETIAPVTDQQTAQPESA